MSSSTTFNSRSHGRLKVRIIYNCIFLASKTGSAASTAGVRSLAEKGQAPVKNATEICFRRLIVARTRWVGGVAFCLGVASLSAQPPVSSPPKVLYKTAASVLALPYDVAQRGGFAMIQGTVTLSYGKALVVHDRTGGIWVDSVSGKYAPGDLLTVIGPVAPGRYSPQIVAPRVQLIGKRPLPSPRTVSFRELSSGMEDAQYVAVEGTIRAVRLNPMPVLGGVELTLAMPDGRVEAILSSEYEQFARSLIDAKVQITATALSRKNDNMQQTGLVLEIADVRGISVIQPAPPDLFRAPIVPIGSLLDALSIKHGLLSSRPFERRPYLL